MYQIVLHTGLADDGKRSEAEMDVAFLWFLLQGGGSARGWRMTGSALRLKESRDGRLLID